MAADEPNKAPQKPGDTMKAIGGGMVGLCILCMLVGGKIARTFFPESQGQGLTPTVLMILIPLWSMGIIGLVLLLVGWIRGKVS